MDLLSKKYAQAKEIAELKQDIEAYKQSEQEATEIIAELKHTLDCKNGTIETLKAENEKLIEDLGIANKYVNKYHQTLQEIKNILLQAMDVKSNAYNHFLKVEQAIDLITETEEE